MLVKELIELLERHEPEAVVIFELPRNVAWQTPTQGNGPLYDHAETDRRGGDCFVSLKHRIA